MGTLSSGYFLHQCSISIIQKAAEPEKNERNVFIGYTIVFLTYVVVGCLGYIAYMSDTFSEKRDKKTGLIPSNFLLIYDYSEPKAVIIRFLLFVQMLCAYPTVNHF